MKCKDCKYFPDHYQTTCEHVCLVDCEFDARVEQKNFTVKVLMGIVAKFRGREMYDNIANKFWQEGTPGAITETLRRAASELEEAIDEINEAGK